VTAQHCLVWRTRHNPSGYARTQRPAEKDTLSTGFYTSDNGVFKDKVPSTTSARHRLETGRAKPRIGVQGERRSHTSSRVHHTHAHTHAHCGDNVGGGRSMAARIACESQTVFFVGPSGGTYILFVARGCYMYPRPSLETKKTLGNVQNGDAGCTTL